MENKLKTMIMNEKFLKLIGIIKIQLFFFKENEKIKISREQFTKENLTEDDLEKGFKKLLDDKIISSLANIIYNEEGRLLSEDNNDSETQYCREQSIYFFIDRQKFYKLFEGKQNNEKMPEIFYDKETGLGYINSKKFKLKDNQPDYKIFAKLYCQIGKKLLRSDILKIIGREESEAERINNTFAINELAKKIRSRTNLNTEQLVNNNGNLTLRAIKIKDFPKPTPNLP